MPTFEEGITNVFLYYPSKRKPRAEAKGGAWVEGSMALIMVCPDSFDDAKVEKRPDDRPGLKFGGREHPIGTFGDRCIVLQHGSDVLGG